MANLRRSWGGMGLAVMAGRASEVFPVAADLSCSMVADCLPVAGPWGCRSDAGLDPEVGDGGIQELKKAAASEGVPFRWTAGCHCCWRSFPSLLTVVGKVVRVIQGMTVFVRYWFVVSGATGADSVTALCRGTALTVALHLRAVNCFGLPVWRAESGMVGLWCFDRGGGVDFWGWFGEGYLAARLVLGTEGPDYRVFVTGAQNSAAAPAGNSPVV